MQAGLDNDYRKPLRVVLSRLERIVLRLTKNYRTEMDASEMISVRNQLESHRSAIAFFGLKCGARLDVLRQVAELRAPIEAMVQHVSRWDEAISGLWQRSVQPLGGTKAIVDDLEHELLRLSESLGGLHCQLKQDPNMGAAPGGQASAHISSDAGGSTRSMAADRLN